MDDLLTKRRRLLQGVSAGGIAFLAGCSEFLDSDDRDDRPADEEDDVETEPEDEAGDEIPDDEPEEDTPEDDDPNGYTPEEDDPEDEPEEDTPEEDDPEDEPEEDTDEETTREVGVVVTLDEEAIDDLEEGIATGEIDQDELMERQREIIEESVENLVEVLENETGVEVLEEIPELAALRVEGRPSELIDVIESEHAQALVPASDLTPS